MSTARVSIVILTVFFVVCSALGAFEHRQWVNSNPDTWIHGYLATVGLGVTTQSAVQWIRRLGKSRGVR